MTYSPGCSSRPSKRRCVEVEHAAGLGLEVGVAREDPRALLPRLQRAVVQPAPDRRRRRVGDALLDHQPVQLSAREAAQRPVVHAPAARTRPRRPRRPAAGGKRRGRPARGLSLSPSMPCSQNRRRHLLTRPADDNRSAPRSPCRSSRRPRTGSAAPAAPPETAASTPPPDAQAPARSSSLSSIR